MTLIATIATGTALQKARAFIAAEAANPHMLPPLLITQPIRLSEDEFIVYWVSRVNMKFARGTKLNLRAKRFTSEVQFGEGPELISVGWTKGNDLKRACQLLASV
jgi:hypothetical protein